MPATDTIEQLIEQHGAIVGHHSVEPAAEGVSAVLRFADGYEERRIGRLTVEREHRDGAGELVASGMVASSDDGSARVAS